jgi:transcriptional regulator of arginine metabolism
MNDRHRLVAALLDRHEVTSQPQLVELLAAHGIHVTQATVSRDLDRLGAIRVRKGGHLVYALPGPAEPVDPHERLREALALVRSLEPSMNMLVLKTPPGSAQGVAWAIDATPLDEVVGTIAGDDTILLICRSAAARDRLTRRIRTLAGEVKE